MSGPNDSEILIAEGVPVDVVEKVGPMYDIDDDKNVESLRRWQEMARSVVNGNLEGEVTGAFVDTLIAYPGYAGPNVFAAFYGAWWKAVLVTKCSMLLVRFFRNT
jgi:hypothetical protein